MQKKIISMAIAGLVSSFAFAQSNVTIYGVMDAGFSSYSYDKGYNSTTGLKDGRDARSTGVYSDGMTSSRLGFKGEENLGNGLKAIFQLETGVQLDSKDGDGAWGGLKIRQSNIGLTGSFGTVKVGTQLTMSDAWHGGSGAENMGNLSSRNIVGLRGSFAYTKEPGVVYLSPNLSGLTLGVGAFFIDEGGAKETITGGKWAGKTTDTRSTMYNLGAQYLNGPFSAAVTYAGMSRDVGKTSKEWTLSAAYDFKVVKVFGAYEATKDVYANQIASDGSLGYMSATALAAVTPTTKTFDNATWSLGVSIPVMAKGQIHLGYSETDNDLKKSDAKGFLVGYQHDLSKRTTVYAAYQYLDTEKFYNTANMKGRYRNAYGNNGSLTTGNITGRDADGFSVGLRHSF